MIDCKSAAGADVVREVIDRTLAGTIAFPEVVQKLAALGIESYHVDLVRGENRYYWPDGRSRVESVALDHPAVSGVFSEAGVVSALRQIQANRIDYREFIRQIAAAGSNYYVAYLSGKRVTYSGRNGDSYVEHFPGSR